MLRKSQTMVIDFNTNIEQKAPSGRPFKVVGTTKLTKSYLNGFYDWVLQIKYLDDNKYAAIKVDTNGKFIKLIKKT